MTHKMLVFAHLYSHIQITLAVFALMPLASYSYTVAIIYALWDLDTYAYFFFFVGFATTLWAFFFYHLACAIAVWTGLDYTHKALTNSHLTATATMWAGFFLPIFCPSCLAGFTRAFLRIAYVFLTAKNRLVKINRY